MKKRNASKNKKVRPKKGDLVWLDGWGVVCRFIEWDCPNVVVENTFYLKEELRGGGNFGTFAPFFSLDRVKVISQEEGWKLIVNELNKTRKKLKKKFDDLCQKVCDPNRETRVQIRREETKNAKKSESKNKESSGRFSSDPIEFRYGQNARGNMPMLHNIQIK